VVKAFAEQASIAVDHAQSEVFWNGRAASLMALAAGLRCLREQRARAVLVGGADTFLDPPLLARLDREQRISGEEITDGFIPGEGAAFLSLTAVRTTGAAPPAGQIAVLGAGVAEDAGHRYGAEPARGEGLAHAIDALLTSMPRPPRPIATVFAGFNGESFFAKEWGVAHIRHHDSFAERIRLTHPADCFGDAGAAMGALLMALAGAELARGDGEGPTLVFASSDRADRACALLDVVA
jgi:3-oxoacyl-[acyl-carrier-protein] synthase-1